MIKNELEIRREEELRELEETGINPYPYSFEKTHSTTDVHENFNPDSEEEYKVSVAGRIMSLRRMGKATFLNIMDQEGRIQVYFKMKDVPEFYEALKLLDIGDIIGVKGHVFKTRTGETTVYAKEANVLSKSLKPLPIAKEEVDDEGNKIVHDAFADKELRYRKRYIDLIVNSNVRDTFIKRSKIISSMRRYFDSKGWMEVETPILQPLYGGASARPFITHHNTLDVDLYIETNLTSLTKVWLGEGSHTSEAMANAFQLEGSQKLIETFESWFGSSKFASIPKLAIAS